MSESFEQTTESALQTESFAWVEPLLKKKSASRHAAYSDRQVVGQIPCLKPVPYLGLLVPYDVAVTLLADQ
jgi:hypothetical protein